MTTVKDPKLEELITEMGEILIYPLWGKNHSELVKDKLDYQIRFDEKFRNLAVIYAKALSAKEDWEVLGRIRARAYNRVCKLVVLNQQTNPDNRVCGSCLEEKSPKEFMNFSLDPKAINVCSKCSRKVAQAVQDALGLPR